MGALADAFRAPGARRFFSAHAQSSLGSGIAMVGLPLLAYQQFHSPWALTGVLLPELLPAVALGPVLGALADRLPRRTCMVAADALRCVAFVLLALVPSLPLMIASALLAGIGTALFNPAALASLPSIAPSARRPAAMSLYAALDDLGLTVGPALAGALLLVFGPHTLMGLNAVTYLISAVMLSTLPLANRHVRVKLSLLSAVVSGSREIIARADVRTLLFSSTVAVLCVGMVNVGEVVLAKDLLKVGGSGLAALVTAAGVGTVVGSAVGARTRMSWEWRRAYILGLSCMAADLVLCAVAPYFGLLLATFALGGFGNGLALVHDRLLLSHAVPEVLHGRLFALHKAFTSAAFALSFVFAGVLISTFGVQTMFLCGGLALLIMILIVRPQLRQQWPEPVEGLKDGPQPPAEGQDAGVLQPQPRIAA
jgi:MFS family permease